MMSKCKWVARKKKNQNQSKTQNPPPTTKKWLGWLSSVLGDSVVLWDFLQAGEVGQGVSRMRMLALRQDSVGPEVPLGPDPACFWICVPFLILVIISYLHRSL